MSTGRFLLAAVGVGFAVAVALTWPLVGSWGTHFLDDGTYDAFQFAWNLWWVRESILDLHQLPFRTQLLYHPTGVPLLFHTGAFSLGVLSIPFQLLGGIVSATNAMVLANPALTVLTAALLARELTDDAPAALTAGVLAAVNPLTAWMVPVLYLSCTWVIVALLLGWYRLQRRQRWIDVALLVLFVPFATFASQEYAMIGLSLVSLDLLIRVVAGSRLGLRAPWPAGTVAFLGGAGLILGSLAGLALAHPAQPPPPNQAHMGSGHLLGYVSPPWLITPAVPFGVVVYLGTAAMVLAAFALLGDRRRATPWAVTVVILLALVLGPYVHLHHPIFSMPPDESMPGSPGIPGPYLLARELFPLLKFFRAPFRWMSGVNVAMAMLAAIGTASARRWWPGRRAGVAVILLVAVGAWADNRGLRGPMVSAAVPAAYDLIRDDPEPCAIMDLPAGTVSGGFALFSSRYMYYQTVHGKALVEGTVSRLPLGTLRLSQRFVRDFHAWPGVKYVVVDRALTAIANSGSQAQVAAITTLAAQQGTRVFSDATHDVYRLETFRSSGGTSDRRVDVRR